MAVVSSCREVFGLFLSTNAIPVGVLFLKYTVGGLSFFFTLERPPSGEYVKSSWSLSVGLHTCYNGIYKGKQWRESERILKNCLSPDCSLQLESIKLESLVIVDQHATVNQYLSLVLSARHTLEVG